MNKSLILRAGLIGALLFTCAGEALAQRGATAHYNACIIKPKFDRPEFVRSTIDRPDFIRSSIQRVELERTTMERAEVIQPVFERPFFIRPTFDTCKSGSESEKVLRRRAPMAAGSAPAASPVVAGHGLLERGPAPNPVLVAEADNCCGGGRGQSRAVR